VKQIRKRITYANVMSSIAVFLVLGGGAAYAAKKIGSNELKSNSVKTGKIVKEAVTTSKIKNESVTTNKIAKGAVTTDKLAENAVSTAKVANGSVTNPKIANDAVTGAKVADGSLTGADINQGSLTSVKAANIYAAAFESTGSKIAKASDPGIKSGGCFLVCSVEFPRDVSECVYTATSTDNGTGGTGEAAMAEAFGSSNKNAVLVAMFNDEGNLISHDFSLTVVCPTT
jgi:hypothetical protein